MSELLIILNKQALYSQLPTMGRCVFGTCQQRELFKNIRFTTTKIQKLPRKKLTARITSKFVTPWKFLKRIRVRPRWLATELATCCSLLLLTQLCK